MCAAGTLHLAAENETVADIAQKMGVPAKAVLHHNLTYRGITAKAQLEKGTKIYVPSVTRLGTPRKQGTGKAFKTKSPKSPPPGKSKSKSKSKSIASSKDTGGSKGKGKRSDAGEGVAAGAAAGRRRQKGAGGAADWPDSSASSSALSCGQ